MGRGWGGGRWTAFAVRIWAVLAAGLLAGAASAQDYEREKRWADEIVPGIVVGDPVWLETGAGRPFLGLLTEPKDARTALVLVHGIGMHPDHGLVGQLRGLLADRGYATLSIQMPVQAKEATAEAYYPAVFPEAIDRIGVAASYLRQKGYRRLILVSHSMGAWMSNAYLDAHARDTPYMAWVCIGLTGSYSLRTASYRFPIFDAFGENDLLPTLRGEASRARVVESKPGSRQIRFAGADHYFNGKEPVLADEIDRFIRSLPLLEPQ